LRCEVSVKPILETQVLGDTLTPFKGKNSAIFRYCHFSPSRCLTGKSALAVQHLTEAKRMLSQFGKTPTLARVEGALVELTGPSD
jgi:hypothetical protein